MPFILSSSYQFNGGKTLIQLGLNSKKNFEPNILFNDSNGNTLLLNFTTYIEILKLLEEYHYFFSSDLTILLLSSFPSKFIQKFLLQFDVINQIVTVEVEEQIVFTINNIFWYELCRCKDIFSLQLNLLSKYALYARVLYSRFISFLIDQPANPSITILICVPTSLIPEHKHLKFNFDDFDHSLCLLVDAEIRYYCIGDIVKESISARNNQPYTHNSYYSEI